VTLNLRRSLGIEEATTISATFADLANISGESPYIAALVEILKRFPGHFHLFSGPGNVRGIRARLHAEGVLPRVRFMGDMADNEPLIAVCDIYLAYFPGGDPVVVRARGAGRPSVELDSGGSSAAATTAECVAQTVPDYIQLASDLLRKATKQRPGAS
jgi:hypothetical protein